MKNKEKSSRSGLSLEEGVENIIAKVMASKILQRHYVFPSSIGAI